MYNSKVVCATARCCGHCVWHFRALGTSLICPYSCVFSVAYRVCCCIYCFHSTAGLVGIYGNVTGLCVKKHDYSRLGDVQYSTYRPMFHSSGEVSSRNSVFTRRNHRIGSMFRKAYVVSLSEIFIPRIGSVFLCGCKF